MLQKLENQMGFFKKSVTEDERRICVLLLSVLDLRCTLDFVIIITIIKNVC